jgi:hypothetical protein
MTKLDQLSKNDLKNIDHLIEYLLTKTDLGGITISEKTIIYTYELANSFDENLRTSYVISAIQEMKKNKQRGTTDFLNIYKKKEIEFDEFKSTNEDEWKLYVPFDVAIDIESFKIGDVEFSVLRKEDLDIRFCEAPINEAYATLRNVDESISFSELKDVLPNYVLVLKCKGKNMIDVWQAYEPVYNQIRGIVEFVMSPSFQMIPFFKKRTKIGLPKIILGKNQYSAYYIDLVLDVDHTYNTLNPKQKQKDSLVNIFEIFHSKPIQERSFTTLLADIFSLYAQAMDSIYNHNCLLSLWQICERICCAETFGGNTKKIIKRLTWHSERINLAGSGWSKALEAIANKRNNIVHRGDTFVDQEEIDVLRIIVNSTIRWLLSLHKELQTEEQLEGYYEARTLSNTDLKRRKNSFSPQVLSLIENERNIRLS